MLAAITMSPQYHAPKVRIAGLTLIEIMVALAVLAIVLAVAAPSMADLLEKRRVNAAAEEVLSLLNYAKAETNATDSLLFVRFDPDTSNPPGSKVSCAMVATSTGLNKCRCYLPAANVCAGTTQRSLRLFQLPKTHVKFDAFSTNWGGSANNFRFMREQNSIAPENLAVDVVGLNRGFTLRVEVNSIGRVRICAPTAPQPANAALPFNKMNGYGACS